MKVVNLALALLTMFALTACGDDSGSESEGAGGPGGSASERGGPHALVGTEWAAEQVEQDGFTLDLSFEFSDTHITATNTCDGTLSVETQSPVKYTYQVEVPTAGRTDEEQGGDSCFASVDAGTFNFEIADNKLITSAGGETFEFEPAGSVAGLYGTWTASGEGITLEWSMGNGKIVAKSICDNGLTAEVEVAANFTNQLQILEASSNVAEDEFGLTCNVSIDQATLEYYFSGNDLVFDFGGQELSFSPK